MEDQSFDRSHYTLLKQAVNGLSGVCDGAETRDDQGFDGSDTRAGHLYAFLPLDAWPLSAFHRAWRWTKKYHRQLEQMQIDCSGLPEPPRFEHQGRQIALQPDTRGFFVTFPYDDELIAAFRQIPGQDLHTIPIGTSTKLFFRYRTVKVVTGAGKALLAFADHYDFRLGPGTKTLAASCDMLPAIEEQDADQHEYRIVVESGTARAFALYFPRIAALNDEVKRIPGRSFAYSGGFHWVIPATAPAADALLEFIERHPHFFLSPDVKKRLDALMGRV
ncbi:MAG: hypothetical protein H0U76_18520 [Ktedonobacteraceae bacterium]|nr:hypothetical protein [Ktedonobacteraceae bacterium]